jgi:hypothetical protein
MTASVGREVDANLLRGAAPGCAQARANAHDARRQDLGDLIQALGGGHEVGVKGNRHAVDSLGRSPLYVWLTRRATREQSARNRLGEPSWGSEGTSGASGRTQIFL